MNIVTTSNCVIRC